MALDLGEDEKVIETQRGAIKKVERDSTSSFVRDFLTIGDPGSEAKGYFLFDAMNFGWSRFEMKSKEYSSFEMTSASDSFLGNLLLFMKSRGTLNKPLPVIIGDVGGSITPSFFVNNFFRGQRAIAFFYRGFDAPTNQVLTSISLSTSGRERIDINLNGQVSLLSTTGALLLNRLTQDQMMALTPIDGMIVYNTTTHSFRKRQGGVWMAF